MVAFGHGRTRPARRRRVGIPKPVVWTVLEVGDLLWRKSTVCEITFKSADSACVRVRGTFFDLTAPSTVCAFAGHDTSTILYTYTPLRMDTATTDSHGVVHVSWTEVLMLRDIEAEVAAATHSAREPPRSASSDSDSSNVTTTDRADCGILDYDCIAETQQMLPWGSQYRNIVSHEGHAWVLASLDSDPQVVAAALAAEDAARQLDARDTPSLLAYSDGSVIADGIEGSAAAAIRIGNVDVCATIRLAAADSALSSGRSEWAGLLLVQTILRRVRADVTLRLDNLQVARREGSGCGVEGRGGELGAAPKPGKRRPASGGAAGRDAAVGGASASAACRSAWAARSSSVGVVSSAESSGNCVRCKAATSASLSQVGKFLVRTEVMSTLRARESAAMYSSGSRCA